MIMAEDRKAKKAIALVVFVLSLSLVGVGVLSFGVYQSLSYVSFHQAELLFDRSDLSIWVVLNLYADGPMAAGHPLRLEGIQVLGEIPEDVERVFIRVLAPGLAQYWPELNRTLTEPPHRSWGYIFDTEGSGIFRGPGSVNLSASLKLWVEDGTLIDMGVVPRDVSDKALVIAPAEAWNQYNSLRVTAVAIIFVGGMTLVLFTLPSGILRIIELVDLLKKRFGGQR